MVDRLAQPPPEPACSAVFHDTVDDMPPAARHAPPRETYVVMVQKDQIYRVPPPENAYLVERYRANRATASKGGQTCSRSVVRTLGVVIAVAAVVGAAVALSIVILQPDAPRFSVDKLSVHNSSREQPVDYDFFLTAINPNKVTELWYKPSGTVKLLYQGTTLATGRLGNPADGGEDATDFNVLLHGSQHQSRAPKAVEKALGGSKAALALELSAHVPVQVHVGVIGFELKSLAVACSISGAGLGQNVHISSQKCKSSFGD